MKNLSLSYFLEKVVTCSFVYKHDLLENHQLYYHDNKIVHMTSDLVEGGVIRRTCK